ncbi:uncharacterized protein FOMMEDRAFT_121835 [Fomitiporia mediterranea MF3/22]|uniref:uncharacterized protein n=1 Tax=Fomitiporia mediterranea (strain MF3/22) TaxID=694068 RepID=UPI00044073E9|nr:uncharacterized protein FOMMEDRAFT_121835 [Fomitiporia mediterranea MF3/22]EJD04228.1 hypothetical protein FOMMEDRAFT_121835 [Fomitiporia mediterranea MF3/22]
MAAISILDIPQELTEHALVHAEPRDVASFAQTCRKARSLVYEQHDQHLWRRLFLEQPFDDPRRFSCPSSPCPSDSGSSSSLGSCSIDWKQALQQRVYARRIIQKMSSHPPDLAAALSALISVARNAPPMLDRIDESKDLVWLNNLAREHSVFGLGGSDGREWTSEEEQRIAELWSLIGWRDSVLSRDAEDLLQVRNSARAFVYDMRNYMRENHWGPFMADKSSCVNWKHVEAIIVVIYSNLMDLGGLWPDTRPPAHLDAIRAYSAPTSNSHTRDPRDWAGIEGTWRRYVCFMDYRDLFTFNYSSNAYNPSFFEDDEFQEATRLIELNLTITSYGEKKNPSASSTGSSSRASTASPRSLSAPSSPLPLSAPSGLSSAGSGLSSIAKQLPPVIHFVGKSRGGNGNESRVRGTVRMTSDGHIRWRFVSASIYDGHSQWSSEGIQIGGVCSAAGVVGTWTGAHHEEGDPAGPFWLWKVEDDHPSHLHSP